MKLSPSLLQAITLGVAVSTLASACRQHDVNSGQVSQQKTKKENKKPDPCVTCGRG